MDHRLLLGLDGPEVRVSGALARRLVRPLERAMREVARDGAHVHPEVVDFLNACRIAGQRYVEAATTSVTGSTQRQSKPGPPSSGEVDTATAAGMLGTTRRNVVDLISRKRLPARRVGRQYLVDEVDVIAYRKGSC